MLFVCQEPFPECTIVTESLVPSRTSPRVGNHVDVWEGKVNKLGKDKFPERVHGINPTYADAFCRVLMWYYALNVSFAAHQQFATGGVLIVQGFRPPLVLLCPTFWAKSSRPVVVKFLSIFPSFLCLNRVRRDLGPCVFQGNRVKKDGSPCLPIGRSVGTGLLGF